MSWMPRQTFCMANDAGQIWSIPWVAIASVAAVIGYYLGGWRLAFWRVGRSRGRPDRPMENRDGNDVGPDVVAPLAFVSA